MKEKFREKRFSARNLALVGKAIGKIEEYHEQGITMTMRQLFYQMVAADIIPNNLKSYKHLASLITDARYVGMVDWDAIDDNLRKPLMPNTFESVAHILRAAIHSYKLDFWEDMDEYVELYTEKDALSSILAPIAAKHRIPFQVNRGYASASSMYEAAQRFIDKSDKKLTILYLGDHDPSGLDMVRDIRMRLEEFGGQVEIEKIALTGEQVRQYNPPPNHLKRTHDGTFKDSRGQAYFEEYGDKSWEVDALKPEVMIKLVDKAIMAHMDTDLRDEVLEREEREKRELERFAKKHEE